MLSVVKIGGAVVTDSRAMADVAEALTRLPGDVVVVHGGGGDVSDLQERLGLDVAWKDGLRVTTPEGLKAAVMALSGWTNKRVVSALDRAGMQAVGLSGQDGSLVSAFVKRAGALGEVGTVAAVQPAVLLTLLTAGFTPVVSPISAGPGLRPLNVNADEVAGSLAPALEAAQLFLVSEVGGVIERNRVVPKLEPARAQELLDSGVANGGMGVKLAVALAAARAGVHVCIGGPGILRGRGGTLVGSARTVSEVA